MQVCVFGTSIPIVLLGLLNAPTILKSIILQINHRISHLCWDAPFSPCLPTELLLSVQSQYKYLLWKTSLSFPSRNDHSFLPSRYFEACFGILFITLFTTADLDVCLPARLGIIDSRGYVYSPLMYPTPKTKCYGKHSNLKLQTYLKLPQMYLINFFDG